MTARFIVLAKPYRFWSRVDRCGPDDCWEWQGSRNEYGYGGFREDAPTLRLWKAHRVAFMLTTGLALTSDDHICHYCDNPPCCNPNHLYLGDYRTNTADKMSKGRQSRGEARGRALRGRVPSGENHWTRRFRITSCCRGHDLTDPSNVYVRRNGQRRCRICMTETQRERRARKRTA